MSKVYNEILIQDFYDWYYNKFKIYPQAIYLLLLQDINTKFFLCKLDYSNPLIFQYKKYKNYYTKNEFYNIIKIIRKFIKN